MLPSGPVTHAYELPLEPLFQSNLTRAILIGAAAQERPTGEVDIPALVRTICSGTLPQNVPHRPISGLGRRVQLLIDAGKGMQAFAADIKTLIDDTIRYVGYDRLQVRWFRDNPKIGVYAADGEEVAPYRMPRLGESVLLVSELGVGTVRSGLRDAGFAEWLSFADAAVHLDCPVTAIVPYAAEQVPRELRARMRILTWDRSTGVRDLLRGRARADDVGPGSAGSKPCRRCSTDQPRRARARRASLPCGPRRASSSFARCASMLIRCSMSVPRPTFIGAR